MPIADLVSYESDLLDTVTEILHDDTDLEEYVGENSITRTILKQKLPLHYASRAIQVKDPNSDFTALARSEFKEHIRSTIEIYCYEDVMDDTEGEVLSSNDRLLKTVGLVIQAINRAVDEAGGRINGFHWWMIDSVSSGEPIAVLGSDETFDLVACKTITYSIRKEITGL